MPAVRPANSGGYRPLTHRWVWRRSRLRQAIADAASGMTAVFVCGIAGNQTEMMDILHQVLLLVIDEQTQEARLAGSPRQASLLSGSRSELADQSSRRTRCRRGDRLDGTARPSDPAETLLGYLDLQLALGAKLRIALRPRPGGSYGAVRHRPRDPGDDLVEHLIESGGGLEAEHPLGLVGSGHPALDVVVKRVIVD